MKQEQRDAVLARIGASEETAERLNTLVATLVRWAPKINLVSRSTLADVWERHVEDSAQLLPAAPLGARTWIDLGSGAGFPGLVVAAMACARPDPIQVTLVESDARKAAFLRQAATDMGVTVDIRISRIEALEPRSFDVVSARALTSLPKLMDLAHPLLAPDGVAIFPKGEGWRSELTEARAAWHMGVEARPSVTHPDAVILVLSEISRV